MNDEAALSTETALDWERSRRGEGVAVEGGAERGGAAGLCSSRGFRDACHSLDRASKNVTCEIRSAFPSFCS